MCGPTILVTCGGRDETVIREPTLEWHCTSRWFSQVGGQAGSDLMILMKRRAEGRPHEPTRTFCASQGRRGIMDIPGWSDVSL